MQSVITEILNGECISLRQRLSEVGTIWSMSVETLLSDCCTADLAVVLMFTGTVSTVEVKGLLKMPEVNCGALK